MTAPTTPHLVQVPGSGAESFTVAGLIRALQQHIEIDPERANHPVEIWPLGGDSGRRYLPAVVTATGNDDPEVGGHLKVALCAIRSPKGF